MAASRTIKSSVHVVALSAFTEPPACFIHHPPGTRRAPKPLVAEATQCHRLAKIPQVSITKSTILTLSHMKSQHHIIYIPGIGDDRLGVQSLIVKFWRLYGVYGHCHPMPWAGRGAYGDKITLLLTEIDSYAAAGHRVSLVGASAGATAALNAYVVRRSTLRGVILVCAKLNHPETVSPRLLQKNPAFKLALAATQANLKSLSVADKQRFHLFYSVHDSYVPHRDSYIFGVPEDALPTRGHAFSILFCLTLGFPKLLSVLRTNF